MLEVCIPSSLDPTIAPPGCHVMSIFSQYTPYKLADGEWTEERKEQYANTGKGWHLIRRFEGHFSLGVWVDCIMGSWVAVTNLH